MSLKFIRFFIIVKKKTMQDIIDLTARAILIDDGILLKSQYPLMNSKGEEFIQSKNDFSWNCFSCLNSTGPIDPASIGLLPTNTLIPYGRVLNAKDITHSGNKNIVELTFVIPISKDIIPKTLTLSIDYVPTRNDKNDSVANEILNRSYKHVNRNKSILIIINPYGGKGKAKDLFQSKVEPILIAAGSKYEIAYTKYSGHAIDIAKNLNLDDFDTIACASGDGVPYEVINGLYQRTDRVEAFNRLTITQLPCGSGNAMSISCHWTMNPSYATLCLLKSIESRIDVMCCTQPSYHDNPRLSFLSQTYGVIAESDINTEFIRWMGPKRFELGVAFNIFQRKCYPCDIYVKYAAKSKKELKVHYLQNKDNGSLIFDNESDEVTELTTELTRNQTTQTNLSTLDTNPLSEDSFKLKYPYEKPLPNDWEKIDSNITESLSIFYTGKMPYISDNTKFFPAALPADGTIDMVITDTRTPVTRMTPILLSLDKGSHVLQPEVIHSKILAYKMIPKIENSVISVDGENFPLEPIQVEVMPGLVKTLLRNGCYVDTQFDSM